MRVTSDARWQVTERTNLSKDLGFHPTKFHMGEKIYASFARSVEWVASYSSPNRAFHICASLDSHSYYHLQINDFELADSFRFNAIWSLFVQTISKLLFVSSTCRRNIPYIQSRVEEALLSPFHDVETKRQRTISPLLFLWTLIKSCGWIDVEEYREIGRSTSGPCRRGV